MAALRKLPYIPLYVQDFTSDEKLTGCSASAVGVYIFLLCFLHKSETYGKLVLRPKDILTDEETDEIKKQVESKTKSKTKSKIIAFAKRLQRNMPFELYEIATGLTELEEERVITVEGIELYQKRMVRDGDVSEKRSNNGALGGRPAKEKTTQKSKSESKTESKSESELKTNTEIENEYENNIEKESKRVQGERKPTTSTQRRFTPPTLEEVMEYCQERNNGIDAIQFFDYYEANGWVQGKNKPLKDWKAAVRTWERNGIVTNNSRRNGQHSQTETAATGRYSEVCGDTPAKKTRHTTL